jgi:serine/threonine protein kinase/DNA-binding CsgD family transcriptional regulator
VQRVVDSLHGDLAMIDDVRIRAVRRPPSSTADSPLLARLSPCEQRVAVLVGQGFSNKEIGAVLGTSPHTVRKQTISVYMKLGARGRSHLVALLGASEPHSDRESNEQRSARAVTRRVLLLRRGNGRRRPVPSQATRDRPPYEPGAVLAGKYAICRILGEGGMAVVYAAVDTTCDRQVAIKVLRPSASPHRQLSSARVQREAATVVKLHERTPHVVEVLTAGVSEDQHHLPYYVMERLQGTTLREGVEAKRLAGQPFEFIEMASTVTEIAVALAYAHDMGIVHGDVKPENVYIAVQRDQSYIVKLLDFGVSALLADEGEQGGRRGFSGSRQYAAPEQLDGRAPAPACDVYAIGLVLYEMLTFTLPHDRMNRALTVAETALNVLREPIPDLRKLRRDVPPRLEVLVRNCLAYRPEERPGALQVTNMLRDIKRVLEGSLLGGSETKATDVPGPPTVPVDPNAVTTLGVAGMPTIAGAATAAPTIASPAPITLPLSARRFEPNLIARLPQLPQPESTQRLPQQAPPPPTWAASHSVEPFASRTQPEPTETTGPERRRRGPAIVVATSLVVCVGVLGIAADKVVHRTAALPAAVSVPASTWSTPAVPLLSAPPVSPAVSAAGVEPSATQEAPSASAAPSASSSSTPARPNRPLVVPIHARPASSKASSAGQKPNLGF